MKPRREMRHHLPTLERQPITESPTMRSFVSDSIIIPANFKATRCSRRTQLWSRQTSIIIDLVLSVCLFAVFGGTSSAQSRFENSTDFAKYAMQLLENKLLNV